MKIAVIGAGIGGMAAAAALLNGGHDVTVFEQAPELMPIGAGVALSPNATCALASVGALDELAVSACRPDAVHTRRWQDGRSILFNPLGPVQAGPFPYLTVHRAEVIDALLGQFPADRLRLDHRLEALKQDADSVQLTFASGLSEDFDLVLGADGIHSVVAAAIGMPTEPVASGYAAYRAIIPASRVDMDVPNEHNGWLGPDQHLTHYWISGGRELNVVGIVRSPDKEESWSTAGEPADFREAFAGWDPEVTALLELVDETSLWGLYERPTRDAWHVERVAILGDAAHPMLPFFAQGAAQALEDAATLGRLLEGVTDGEDAKQRLSAFSALRVDRARKIQDIARLNATVFHFADGPEQEQRDALLSAPPRPDDPNPIRNMSWLFGHDAAQHAGSHLEAEPQTG